VDWVYKNIYRRKPMHLKLFAIFAMIMNTGLAAQTAAPTYQAGDTKIVAPWIRATSGRNGAAFMILENLAGDKLVRAEAHKNGESIAETVELHAHIREGDIMRMRPVPAIEVTAMTPLKPGGLHIMFMGLVSPLKAGETIDLTLHFERSGHVTFPALVALKNPYITNPNGKVDF
jgi:copper(I)-binding protein